MSRQHRIAVFPGTFDPMTLGHLDIVERGARLFDELVVAVGENPQKTSVLGQGLREKIVREAVSRLPNVRVESYTGLTVDFVRKLGGAAILRGLRNAGDVHFEFAVAATNRAAGGVETVFIMTSPQYAFTSSSLIRQVMQQGGDVSTLVPAQALAYLQELRGGTPVASPQET